jgi:hypothetical protein
MVTSLSKKTMNEEKLTAEEIAAQQFKSFLEESPLYSKLKINFDEPWSFYISDYVNTISREC